MGSGKSTIAQIFSIMDIPVFSADQAGRELLKENSGILKEIVELLGKEVWEPETNQLNRQKIASIVFRDKSKLNALNRIIHPEVRKKYISWLSLQTSEIIVHEAAILIESGFYKMFDKIILVVAPEEIRIQRIIDRDKSDIAEVKQRIKNQMPEAEKIPYANYIIRNDESELVIPQVINIINENVS